MSTVVTPVPPSSYVLSQVMEVSATDNSGNLPLLRLRAGFSQLSSGVFNWERTVTDGQLRTAAEIREYFRRVEITFPGTYRVEGSDADASFLVYVLRLLGYQEASYDPVSKVLVTGK